MISRHFKPVRSFAVAQEWALPVHDTKRHELDHGLCGGGRRSVWRSRGAQEFLRWREITIASIASVGWGDVRKFLRKNIRKNMEGLYLEHSWTFLNILEHCRSNPKIPQDTPRSRLPVGATRRRWYPELLVHGLGIPGYPFQWRRPCRCTRSKQ